MITAVLFDLDGTLLDRKTSFSAALPRHSPASRSTVKQRGRLGG
jgi:phosphoglycolate phosphatase-like HAD superfamily hydrolase